MTDKDKLITELKAYKDVNEDFKKAWEELKAENARLKEGKGGMQILIDNYIALTEKYHKTLQEIKEIADAKCNECKYGKDGISCKYSDCGEAKLHLITQLITKAEEE